MQIKTDITGIAGEGFVGFLWQCRFLFMAGMTVSRDCLLSTVASDT